MPRLRRSDTSAAGLRRVPYGRGFRYLTAAGSRLPMDRLGAGVRQGWPATQGGFEAAVVRLLDD
jgi:hypothetical protein